MLTDVIEYLAPSLEFMLESHLMDPLTKQPQYTVVAPDMIWYPKNDPPKLLGFDGNPIDRVNNLIRQQVTELDWKGNFKAFLNGGIPWCQRFVDFDSTYSSDIVTTDSSYVQVVNGVAGQAVHNLKTVQTSLVGIFKQGDFGGDVGLQDYVLLNYFWDSRVVRERFWYTGPRTFGFCRWDTSNLQSDGAYKVMQTSNFNTVVKGGFGAITFPYAIPK